MKKTVLITGATRGIGLAFSNVFAKKGYKLVLLGRKNDTLADIVNTFQRLYPNISIHTFSIDLSEHDCVETILEYLHKNSITIDVLVNNAGFGVHGPFSQNNWKDDHNLLLVNIENLLKLTRFLLPSMIAKKEGHILNVSSTSAFSPGPYMSTYYASKAFIYSWSLALSQELKEHGICVTVICPGPTDTDFPSRAKLMKSKIFYLFPLLDPTYVAESGYTGLMKGKRVIVPGFVNYVQWKLIRFIPLEILLRIIGRLH